MAATLDIITLAEGRAAINMLAQDTTQDSEIAAYVTAASQRIDQLAGPVVVRTITAELHDGTGSEVRLRYYPVSSITSVTEYVGATGTVLTAETVGGAYIGTNYALDARYGVLTRRSGGVDAPFSYGRGRVAVTYVAGRFANTAAVDPLYKTATTVLLSHWWRREQGSDPITSYQRSFGLAVPRAVVEMLAGEPRRAMVA